MAHRDIMHTSNPAYEYSFCWTIDDFHHSSLVVQGPAFSPIPGCSDKFCFEVQFRFDPVHPVLSRFYFKLLELTSNDHYRTVCFNVTLQNTETKLCEMALNVGRKIEKCTNLMTHCDAFQLPGGTALDEASILSSFGLADSRLTLHGTLTFAGFLATSSIFSISVPKPSEDYGELAKDFKSLYESGFGSDVTFTVGDKLYPAHKLVLNARSEVFAKMFEHNMLESNTNNVIISDIDPDTFHKFLLFLYTGTFEEDNQPESVVDFEEDDQPVSVVDLYAVAKKYQVKSLQKACVALLGNSLTPDSLCDSLVVADLHNDEEFKGMVKVLIRGNFFNVVGTAKWAELVTTRPALASEVLESLKPASK